MKKITLCFVALILSLAFYPATSNAAANVETPTSTAATVPAEVNAAITRLIEIRDMDKSNLSSAEKKELRKEVRSLKREVRSNGRGIYLSVGAAIIILLLLILIL